MPGRSTVHPGKSATFSLPKRLQKKRGGCKPFKTKGTEYEMTGNKATLWQRMPKSLPSLLFTTSWSQRDQEPSCPRGHGHNTQMLPWWRFSSIHRDPSPGPAVSRPHFTRPTVLLETDYPRKRDPAGFTLAVAKSSRSDRLPLSTLSTDMLIPSLPASHAFHSVPVVPRTDWWLYQSFKSVSELAGPEAVAQKWMFRCLAKLARNGASTITLHLLTGQLNLQLCEKLGLPFRSFNHWYIMLYTLPRLIFKGIIMLIITKQVGLAVKESKTKAQCKRAVEYC